MLYQRLPGIHVMGLFGGGGDEVETEYIKLQVFGQDSIRSTDQS